MSIITGIRWKERFENFKKAFLLLKRTIEIEDKNEAELGGLIQFYEITFELSRKLLKDYLETLGNLVKSPREAIKTAVKAEIINSEHTWLDALTDRNTTAHVYDEISFLHISEKIINTYFFIIQELYLEFEKKYTNE